MVSSKLRRLCKHPELHIYGAIALALALGGWLGYWPYVQGWLPGWHGAALIYSQIAGWVAGLTLLGLIYGLVPGVMILTALAAMVHGLGWRWGQRWGYRLLIGVLAWLGIAIALAPALGAIYDRTTALTVEPWQATYRTAFVTPMVDDTYGDVMALRCGRWGLCTQVHRQYVDFNSAEQAQFVYDSDRDRVGLHLRGEWVYGRSRHRLLCQQPAQPCTDWGGQP
jgi:hypothetical protein